MAQYKVEFLPANLKVEAGQMSQAAGIIEERLNAWAQQGWVLDQITQIAVVEAPGCGCLGALLGMKATVMEYNVLVFRHD